MEKKRQEDVPKEPIPEVATSYTQSGNPTATITETSTITTAITTTIVNDAVMNASDTSNTSLAGSNNILLAALLGTIGLIIILSGLLIIIIWLRRGEKTKGGIENRGLTQLNDDGNTSVSMNDMNRPRDPDDEQLPSYAEAVVRGRSSAIIT